MTDISIPEQAAVVDTGVASAPRAWRKEVWVPVGLFAAHLLAGVLFPHWMDALGRRRLYYLAMLLGGVLFTQPLLWAVWSALAPQRAVFRIPIGAAACVGAALVMAAFEPELGLMMAHLGLFALFLLVFALARRIWRRRLACGDEATDLAWGEARFSVRYLLLWTTVAALLAAVGRAVLGDASVDMTNSTAREVLGAMVSILSAFTVVMAPGGIAASLLLAPKARLAPALCVWLVGAVSAAYVCVTVMVWIWGPPPPGFGEVWGVFTCVSLGAGASLMLTAAGLRWAGYRVVRRV